MDRSKQKQGVMGSFVCTLPLHEYAYVRARAVAME